MAQQVKIAGALFNDVPYIQCPDVNDVYHPFVDPSVTTAAASDVAQGKQFIAADGTLTTGTASGGGTSIVWGTIRGDAELVKQWTYDKKIHADEGVTIPSYSTTATALKASASLSPTISVDFAGYGYLTLIRGIVTPEYSIQTTGKGRFCYAVHSYVHYVSSSAAGLFKYNGVNVAPANASSQYVAFGGSNNKIVYYSSASAINLYSGTYGVYLNITAPSVATPGTSPYTSSTMTVNSPALSIRGNTTYFTNTYYNALTDIRYQYIIEVYRVPTSATVNGWEQESQLKHVIDCVNNNGGTLT